MDELRTEAMDIKLETITPEMAKRWLEKNVHNRHLAKSRVKTLKQAMLDGDWKVNGDTIRFYDDGTLSDGQTRLTACAESGVTIQSFVVRGVPRAASATIDKGAPRSGADNLVLDLGLEKGTARTVAAAAWFAIAHDVGIANWAQRSSHIAPHCTGAKLEEWFMENEAEIDSTLRFMKQSASKASYFLPKGAIMCLHMLFTRVDDELASGFLDKVLNGIDIERDSPEDNLRTAMIRVVSGNRKMSVTHRVYSVAKVFKSRVAGRAIKHSGNTCFRPGIDNVPTFPGFGKKAK